MLKIVDMAGFQQIICGQCGDCCETFFPEEDPAQKLTRILSTKGRYQGMTHEETVRDLETIIDMLIAKENGGYTCRHFKRLSPEKGVCTIHERRPQMCARFPYGKPTGSGYERCTYNVRVVHQVLPIVKGEN